MKYEVRSTKYKVGVKMIIPVNYSFEKLINTFVKITFKNLNMLYFVLCTSYIVL
jgi:hypothetical protein